MLSRSEVDHGVLPPKWIVLGPQSTTVQSRPQQAPTPVPLRFSSLTELATLEMGRYAYPSKRNLGAIDSLAILEARGISGWSR